jgi:hypothetical protein
MPSETRTRRPPAGTDRSGRSAISRGADAVGIGAVRDAVLKGMLAPINAVLLTRERIEEVVEDAVRRGRMTRDDAQHMVQTLLQYGAKQTDDFLADLERMLGRGPTLQQRSASGGRRRGRRSRRPSSNLPIANYDKLSAPQVQERLDGLAPGQLRKLRDYERRHANRKTVLDRIARKLR